MSFLRVVFIDVFVNWLVVVILCFRLVSIFLLNNMVGVWVFCL